MNEIELNWDYKYLPLDIFKWVVNSFAYEDIAAFIYVIFYPALLLLHVVGRVSLSLPNARKQLHLTNS